MDVKSKVDELGLQALALYDETKECIKAATTEKDKQLVRELLNAMESQQNAPEGYYKHPEEIPDIPMR